MLPCLGWLGGAGWEAPASVEPGVYVLRQSALLSPTLHPSWHTKGNRGADGVGWKEFSVETEDMEGVGEWKPCSQMGAAQGAVVLQGWAGGHKWSACTSLPWVTHSMGLPPL